MLSHPQTRRAITSLHEAYNDGDLKILIGAGASVPCGFPTWDELSRTLIEQSIKEQQPTLSAAEIADSLFAKLGKERAADFVQLQPGVEGESSSHRLRRLLRDVLYSGRSMEELPTTALHRQIAAMNHAKVYTTNYDPLLEIAMLRRSGAAEIKLRHKQSGWTAFDEKQDLVAHLHGYVDPSEKVAGSGKIVIADSHYYQLALETEASANHCWHELMTGGKVLILGMSLADPNLRRILYRQSADQSDIYLLLKRDNSAADKFLEQHWRVQQLTCVFIDDWSEIPGILRDIKWGVPGDREMDPWCVLKDALFSRVQVPSG